MVVVIIGIYVSIAATPITLTPEIEMIVHEEHKDLIGREVKVEDAVAFSHHNTLYIGKVIKVTPKQVRVVPLLTKYRADEGYLKYTNQCVLIGGPDLIVHLLKSM